MIFEEYGVFCCCSVHAFWRTLLHWETQVTVVEVSSENLHKAMDLLISI